MPKVYLGKSEKQVKQIMDFIIGQRAVQGVSQETLALRLGMSQQSVSKRLQRDPKRRTDMTLQDFVIIMDELGVDVANIVTHKNGD